MKKEVVEFVKVDNFDKLLHTERNIQGFGSSGSKKRKIAFTESQPSPESYSDSDTVIVVEDAEMSVNGSVIVSEKSLIVE